MVIDSSSVEFKLIVISIEFSSEALLYLSSSSFHFLLVKRWSYVLSALEADLPERRVQILFYMPIPYSLRVSQTISQSTYKEYAQAWITSTMSEEQLPNLIDESSLLPNIS